MFDLVSVNHVKLLSLVKLPRLSNMLMKMSMDFKLLKICLALKITTDYTAFVGIKKKMRISDCTLARDRVVKTATDSFHKPINWYD